MRPLADSLFALPVNGTIPLAYGLDELLTVVTPFKEDAEVDPRLEEFEDEPPDTPDDPELPPPALREAAVAAGLA